MINTEYKTELKSISKNASLSGFGIVFTNIMGFVNNAIITRVLGAELYGLFVLATSIVTFIGNINQLGFNSTIVRYVSFFSGKQEYRKAKGTVIYSLRTLTIFSLFLSIILFIISPVISVNLFNRPELTPLLRALIIAVPFMAITVVFYSVFSGLKQIKYIVLSNNLINPLTFFAVITIIFILNYSITALIWAWISTIVIAALFAFYFLNKEYLKVQKEIRPIIEKRELWSYSGSMYINNLINTTLKLAPVFIIGYFLSNNDLGIFNICFKLALLGGFSLEAFKIIFSPVISGLFAQSKFQLIEQLNKTISKWVFSISLVIYSNIILFAEPILNIFGQEFTVGLNILLILSLGELINSSMGLTSNILEMCGKQKVEMRNSISSLILLLTLNWILTPTYGITGAAISYATTLVLVNILRVIEIYAFEKIHPFKLSSIKPVAAAGAAFIITFWFKNILDILMVWETAIGFLIFITSFSTLILVLKLDPEDRYILDIISEKFTKKDPNSKYQVYETN